MESSQYQVINPGPEDFNAIQALCKKVYPFVAPWNLEQLKSHQQLFKQGQLAIKDQSHGDIVGLAFGLIINWDDYEAHASWKDFTDAGYFTNHDPENGKTLYGAEIMVDPDKRGMGLGKMLYQARRELCQRLGLLRIRAGARLRGYSTYQNDLTPRQYVKEVVNKKIFDPTLSFQLKHGFVVLDVVEGYLGVDPESLGFAAIIEWLNPQVATETNIDQQRKKGEQFLHSS